MSQDMPEVIYLRHRYVSKMQDSTHDDAGSVKYIRYDVIGGSMKDDIEFLRANISRFHRNPEEREHQVKLHDALNRIERADKAPTEQVYSEDELAELVAKAFNPAGEVKCNVSDYDVAKQIVTVLVSKGVIRVKP